MFSKDQKILFTALAFLAVAHKNERRAGKKVTEEVKLLAKLIGTFCSENLDDINVGWPEETGAEELDRKIEGHIQELKERQETTLPEDKSILIKFYDRLQQRKARRMSRTFYANATEAKLADLVLHFLDEEIEDDSEAMLT